MHHILRVGALPLSGLLEGPTFQLAAPITHRGRCSRRAGVGVRGRGAETQAALEHLVGGFVAAAFGEEGGGGGGGVGRGGRGLCSLLWGGDGGEESELIVLGWDGETSG